MNDPDTDEIRAVRRAVLADAVRRPGRRRGPRPAPIEPPPAVIEIRDRGDRLVLTSPDRPGWSQTVRSRPEIAAAVLDLTRTITRADRPS